MNITVLYNKPSRQSQYIETDIDTQESAEEVAAALQQKGQKVLLMAVDEQSIANISGIRTDLIFNLIEWTGIDLPLSDRALALIEKTGIPVTGATRENFLETSDKIPMKKAFDRLGLPTARWQVFKNGSEPIRDDFVYPLILKPSLEHCSIGLSQDSIVAATTEVKRRVQAMIQQFHEPILAEEFVSGREFQVTVYEDTDGLCVLPAAEIIFDSDSPIHMLTYDSRWEEHSKEYKTSHVRVIQDPVLQKNLDEIAKRTFERLLFRDYARLDVRMRGGDIIILEANSNPGLGDDDEYGLSLSYRAVGMTFADFIWKIVASASRRNGVSL